MEFLSDCLLFCIAVVWQWISLLLGAVGAALLLAEQKLNRAFPLKRYFLLVLACGSAWITEHRRGNGLDSDLSSVRGELTKAKDPYQLEADIDNGILGDGPPGGPPGAFILAPVTIRNLGAPTTVDSYHLSVLADGERSYGTTMQIQEGIPLPISDGRIATLPFPLGEALYDKTAEAIPSGARRRGWLYFIFPGKKANEFRTPDAAMELTFNDITKRTHTRIQRLGNQEFEMHHLPGTTDLLLVVTPRSK